MGMLGFLDRAIALIDAYACQKITEDLDSLGGDKSLGRVRTPQNASRTSRRAWAYIETIHRFIHMAAFRERRARSTLRRVSCVDALSCSDSGSTDDRLFGATCITSTSA
jgi:hypothetical protein